MALGAILRSGRDAAQRSPRCGPAVALDDMNPHFRFAARNALARVRRLAARPRVGGRRRRAGSSRQRSEPAASRRRRCRSGSSMRRRRRSHVRGRSARAPTSPERMASPAVIARPSNAARSRARSPERPCDDQQPADRAPPARSRSLDAESDSPAMCACRRIRRWRESDGFSRVARTDEFPTRSCEPVGSASPAFRLPRRGARGASRGRRARLARASAPTAR